MLATLMKQKQAVSLILTDCDIVNLAAAQWELLRQLLKLLQPFKEITKNTSSYKHAFLKLFHMLLHLRVITLIRANQS